MSDLERLFRRLVHNIRHSAPQYLTEPFEVAELYQRLVPYRHNRRELEIDTNDDYEMALCQLLSGENGYLLTEDVMRETIRAELATPNPHTGIFREFAATRVQIAPDALRLLQASPPSVQAATAQAATAQATVGVGAGGAAAKSRIGAAGSAAAPSTASPVGAPPKPAPAAPSPQSAPAPAIPWAQRAASAPRQADAAPRNAAAPSTPPQGSAATANASAATSCRYCGGGLPAGRRVLFCPSCGQNLMVQRCPACGTELEISWKYCITCGRGVAAAT